LFPATAEPTKPSSAIDRDDTMPAPVSKEGDGHAHIEIPEGHDSSKAEGEASPSLTNSKGWDGKLRVPKTALMANPEALTDSDYSDEDNVLEGEEIAADEG
jgi:protein phosphatase 1 regulatory subunit 7